MHDDGHANGTASARLGHNDIDRINGTNACSLDSSVRPKGDLKMVISAYCDLLDRLHLGEMRIRLLCSRTGAQGYPPQDCTWNWLIRLKTNCVNSMDQVKNHRQLESKLRDLEFQLVRYVQP